MKNKVYILVAALLLATGSGMIESAARGGKSQAIFDRYKNISDNFKKAVAANDFVQAATFLDSAPADVKNLYKKELESLRKQLKGAQAKFAARRIPAAGAGGAAAAPAKTAAARPRPTREELEALSGGIVGFEPARATRPGAGELAENNRLIAKVDALVAEAAEGVLSDEELNELQVIIKTLNEKLAHYMGEGVSIENLPRHLQKLGHALKEALDLYEQFGGAGEAEAAEGEEPAAEREHKGEAAALVEEEFESVS